MPIVRHFIRPYIRRARREHPLAPGVAVRSTRPMIAPPAWRGARLPRLGLLAVIASACASGGASRGASAPQDGVQTTGARLEAHARHLTIDTLGPSTAPGVDVERTAAYMSAQFRRLGLQPAGDSGGFHRGYALQFRHVDAAATRLAIGRREQLVALRYGIDYFTTTSTPTALAAPIVRAALDPTGQALTADVRDRVAMVFVPVGTGREVTTLTTLARSAARAAGAVAMLFVLDPRFGDEVMQSAVAGAETAAWEYTPAGEIPSYFARYAPVRAAAAANGVDLSAALTDSAGTLVSGPSLGGLVAEMRSRGAVRADPQPPNVIGVVEGADPALRHSYVVVSAPLDQAGSGWGTWTGTGRDARRCAPTNVASLATLLEIARTLTAASERPARSVIFLATSGTDRGIVGARDFVGRPPVAIDSMVAHVEIDVPGCAEESRVGAVGWSYSSLGPLLDSTNAHHAVLGLTVVRDPAPEAQRYLEGDHLAFASAHIPAIVMTRVPASSASDAAAPVDSRLIGYTHGESAVATLVPAALLDDGAVATAMLLSHFVRAVADQRVRPVWERDALTTLGR